MRVSEAQLEKRRRILLAGLDLARMSGIEIGPLDSPLVRKQDGEITYVDHESTEGILAKYAKYPDFELDKIVPVDVVWGADPLPHLLGKQTADYVLASHVAEHVPDLISWLQEIQAVLTRPAGQLRLILPDKRASLDCLRQETDIVDLLDAYLNRARKPRTRQLLDCALNVAHDWVAHRQLLNNDLGPSQDQRVHTLETALAIASDALEYDKYVDVHCWVFTPRSFARLMETLVKHDFIHVRCADLRTRAETTSSLASLYS